jgi:hypothetical protein
VTEFFSQILKQMDLPLIFVIGCQATFGQSKKVQGLRVEAIYKIGAAVLL